MEEILPMNNSANVFITADKTRNLYELSPPTKKKLINYSRTKEMKYTKRNQNNKIYLKLEKQ